METMENNEILTQKAKTPYPFRGRLGVKLLAFLLAVVCGATAAMGWAYCLINVNALFYYNDRDYTSSSAFQSLLWEKRSLLTSYLDYWARLEQGQTLTYLQQEEFDSLSEELDPDLTNFRYIIRDNITGDILLSSHGSTSLDHVTRVRTDLMDLRSGYIYYDAEVADNPSFLESGGTQLALEFGVDTRLEADDSFRAAQETYLSIRDSRWILYATAGLTAVFLLLTFFLMACSARKTGEEAAVLIWQDRIPYDLYLCVSIFAIICVFVLAVECVFNSVLWRYSFIPHLDVHLVIAAFALAGAVCLGELLLMTTAARFKAHTLLKNTLIAAVLRRLLGGLRGLKRWGKTVFDGWSMTRRAVLVFLLYALLSPCLVFFPILGIPLHGFALFVLCRYVQEWQKIRAGTAAIVGGHPDAAIDAAGMRHFPDLAQHAEQLNDLGGAINQAVEERLKSERMKAELITNVSHDLKTPLTSIISYVDLLKKEEIANETAREYVEVLDRKSQRLKKLTEDLVEASKASTGALTVDARRLDLAQLMGQALGEYSEKFALAELDVISTLPEGEVWVKADGRHLWRILDNLLGNCVKYALKGTRVYAGLTVWEGRAVLTLKNISAQPLNIPADQLTERFVRGDESRTDGGSGLGLSIVRSLADLQGGSFRPEVDGDLFKATLILPLSE